MSNGMHKTIYPVDKLEGIRPRPRPTPLPTISIDVQVFYLERCPISTSVHQEKPDCVMYCIYHVSI